MRTCYVFTSSTSFPRLGLVHHIGLCQTDDIMRETTICRNSHGTVLGRSPKIMASGYSPITQNTLYYVLFGVCVRMSGNSSLFMMAQRVCGEGESCDVSESWHSFSLFGQNWNSTKETV